MKLDYRAQNLKTIRTGLTNDKLAQFMESTITANSTEHWTKSLRQNTVTGNHQWNNLATIFVAHSYKGVSCDLPIAYCMQRASGINV